MGTKQRKIIIVHHYMISGLVDKKINLVGKKKLLFE